MTTSPQAENNSNNQVDRSESPDHPLVIRPLQPQRNNDDLDLWVDKKMLHLANKIMISYSRDHGMRNTDNGDLPSPRTINRILDQLLVIVLPTRSNRFRMGMITYRDVIYAELRSIYSHLVTEVEKSLQSIHSSIKLKDGFLTQWSESLVVGFLNTLPLIRGLLRGDLQAAYKGDPASKSYEEILLAYPCMVAIATYRLAHELIKQDIPLIPRIMSEVAHSVTGIDIHPAARIGRNFFIDHGTGVVIGETTEIGDNVKIYQGVTLGALSFPKDHRNQLIRGQKRHPTIGNHVVIYAGATILGGETVIGDHAVIGGNTWVTSSVPPGTKISIITSQQALKRSASKRR